MTGHPKILCFGEALWDMLPSGKQPGGAPMNVALHLARFGADVRLLSRVGDDDLGRALLEYLAAQGLATDLVQIDARHPTGQVLVDLSDPHAVRYDIAEPAAWDFIDGAEYANVPTDSDTIVVFGSLAARSSVSRGTLFEVLDRVRLKVFDLNLRPPYVDRDVIERLLHRADWVKLNEEELDLVARQPGDPRSPEDGVHDLSHRYALATVCLTLGERGALMRHGGRVFRQPAFHVRVVDTVGCGDAFLAAWLSEMSRGSDPQHALARACAVGALVATRAGANPVLNEADIQALLAG